MNDGANWKDVVGPTVIEAIRDSRPCWYVGRGRGRKPDLEDFTHALPLVGDCGALIFSEPRRSRAAVVKAVDWHRQNLHIPIPGLGLVFQLDMKNDGDLSELLREVLFTEPKTEWIPAENKPHETRLWGEYAKLGIYVYPDREERHVHLLHIGLGGLAAWMWFFETHRIRPSKIIGNPF
jgi:hypothetical protein